MFDPQISAHDVTAFNAVPVSQCPAENPVCPLMLFLKTFASSSQALTTSAERSHKHLHSQHSFLLGPKPLPTIVQGVKVVSRVVASRLSSGEAQGEDRSDNTFALKVSIPSRSQFLTDLVPLPAEAALSPPAQSSAPAACNVVDALSSTF